MSNRTTYAQIESMLRTVNTYYKIGYTIEQYNGMTHIYRGSIQPYCTEYHVYSGTKTECYYVLHAMAEALYAVAKEQ